MPFCFTRAYSVNCNMATFAWLCLWPILLLLYIEWGAVLYGRKQTRGQGRWYYWLDSSLRQSSGLLSNQKHPQPQPWVCYHSALPPMLLYITWSYHLALDCWWKWIYIQGIQLVLLILYWQIDTVSGSIFFNYGYPSDIHDTPLFIINE